MASMIAMLIIATQTEHLKEEATAFMKDVTIHFGLLLTTNRQPQPSQLKEITPLVFVTAIIDVLSLKNRDKAKAALPILDMLVNVVEAAHGGDKIAASRAAVFHRLAERACDICRRYVAPLEAPLLLR